MSNLSEPMVFEDELVEVPVTIKGRNYVLKPLNAGSVVTYKNKATSGVVLDDAGKVVGLGNTGELEPLAVHLALFYDDPSFDKINGTRVPLAVINSLPGKVVGKLAQRVVAISGLQEDNIPDTIETLEEKIKALKETEARLKNEPAPSTEQSE